MTTLTDLKRLLDKGETLTSGGDYIWKQDAYWYKKHGYSPCPFVDISEIVTDPSLWRQRDQIEAEKPVMMSVPIEQWDALQEELKRLREQVK